MPCTENGCGVDLSVTAEGLLRADLQPILSHIEAGTLPDLGVGWTADLTDLITFPIGTPVTVAEGPLETFNNESTCQTANVMSTVTAREVRYDGGSCAWFQVTYESDIDGAGYQTMFVYIEDTRLLGDGLLTTLAKPGGAMTSGQVLPASGSFTYRYRIQITNLADPSAEGPCPADVTSPGLTFCHLSAMN